MIAIYLAPLYLLLNVYFLFRILKWLETCHVYFKKKWIKAVLVMIYVFLAFSILIAFLFPQGTIRRAMKLISNYWLGVLMYLALTILIADLIRLILIYFVKADQKKFRTPKVFKIVGSICMILILLISFYGVCNARNIRTTSYHVTIHKKAENHKKLKIILLADLHLGYNIGCSQMKQMVMKVNQQSPDLIVVAGDIFDNEYDALDDPDQLVKIFRQLKSQYGVYAVYGNHDIDEKILAGFTFGSGREKKVSDPRMDEFVKRAGMKLLRDESVCIDQSFYLYGRPDAEKVGRGISRRKTPKELVNGMDLKKPVIVLDHEPRQLEELNQAGVDLDLCGHTHDGQLFPGNITIHLFWKNPYGYRKVGNAHQIVTSGVGLFGPNMRVGTKAEIVVVNVDFR